VVFANLKVTVEAIQARLTRAGIGHVTVWGRDRNRANRAEALRQFWEVPECRVLVGTKAIEQSLNLQVSRHLVNVDTILNQARMEQLAGRIKRDGSRYRHVFVHNLLTRGTQEEQYMPMLEREAAVAGHVWDESSELFQALPPLQLLQMISG
jgi:SNF2 family DNA or RNA helicase